MVRLVSLLAIVSALWAPPVEANGSASPKLTVHCYFGAGRSYLVPESDERADPQPLVCHVGARNLRALGRRPGEEVYAAVYLSGRPGQPRTPVAEAPLVFDPESDSEANGSVPILSIENKTWMPYVHRPKRGRPRLVVTVKLSANAKGRRAARVLKSATVRFDDRVQWE